MIRSTYERGGYHTDGKGPGLHALGDSATTEVTARPASSVEPGLGPGNPGHGATPGVRAIHEGVYEAISPRGAGPHGGLDENPAWGRDGLSALGGRHLSPSGYRAGRSQVRETIRVPLAGKGGGGAFGLPSDFCGTGPGVCRGSLRPTAVSFGNSRGI